MAVNLGPQNSVTMESKVFHMIWHNAAPHRVQCFGWMAYLGRLKTANYLLRQGILRDDEDAVCIFCGEEFFTGRVFNGKIQHHFNLSSNGGMVETSEIEKS